MAWAAFDEGLTVGQSGSEGGSILYDEEYEGLSRITLEQGADHAPFAITCGIYGWFFHTRYLGPQSVAEGQYEAMKQGLSDTVQLIPLNSDPKAATKMQKVGEAIGDFIERFP